MRLGIDLGTTYSLASMIDAEGAPALIPDCGDPENFHTPSVVHLSGGNAFVGTAAEALLESDPGILAIRFFKRRLGEPEALWIDEQGRSWYAEGVAALILRKLRNDAETFAYAEVEAAVITVPAHFNAPQREAVLAAASLANIPVLGLIEEPVAAALHYGLSISSNGEVLVVYDFGGGTFDVTVLTMDAQGVYVLAKSGITDLGGKELDERVSQLVLQQFERAAGGKPRLGARTLLELRRISEELKIELCMPDRERVRRLVMLGGKGVEVEIARADFEDGIADLLERTEAETLRCIAEAGLKTADVTALLLVGGSSLVPAIETRMRALFSSPSQRVLYHEPTKAVAFGAALHAAQLSGQAVELGLPPEIRGVSGYHLGVRTIDPISGRASIDTLIRKNMPLPARSRKTYYTSRPNQERIVLNLVQFRDPEEKATGIGHLAVGPLGAARSNYPIEVTVEYREDGTISMQAFDAQTGVELERVFGTNTGSGQQLASQAALLRNTTVNGTAA